MQRLHWSNASTLEGFHIVLLHHLHLLTPSHYVPSLTRLTRYLQVPHHLPNLQLHLHEPTASYQRPPLLTSAVTTDLILIRYDNLTPVILDTFILICLTVLTLATHLHLPHGSHPGNSSSSASRFSPWQLTFICFTALALAHTHAASRFSTWQPTKDFTQYLHCFTVLNHLLTRIVLTSRLRQVHLSLSLSTTAAPRLQL